MLSEKETYTQKIQEAVKLLNLDSDVSFDMQYWENVDGNMIYVSSVCERITGYTAEEFIKTHKLIESIIFPEDLTCWNEHSKLAKKGKSHKSQFRIKHKNGNTIWIEHVCKEVSDEDGVAQGFRGSNRDITKRKTIEELYKTSPTTFFIWENKEGWPIIFVSENIEILTGYTEEDFYSGSINYLEIILGKDVAKFSEEVKTHNSTKVNEFTHSPYRIITKDGSIKWVEDQAIIKRKANGEITHFHGSITDITEKKKIEIDLQESKEWFEQINEQSTECISVASLKGDYVYVNSAFCKLMGYSKNELLKMTVFNLKKDKTPNAKIGFEKSKSDIDGVVIEVELQRKDKSIFIAEVTGKPIKINNMDLVLGVVKDVAEQKKIEEALRNSEELYRSVFQNSPMGIFHFNRNGIITDCNNEFAKILGSEREVLIGFNLLKQLQNEKMRKEIIHTLENGVGYFNDYYTTVTSQKTIPIVVHSNAIYNAQNEIIGCVGLVEDISARIESSKIAMEQSFIVENMNDFVYRQNIDGKFAYISSGIAKIVGFTPKEWETHYEDVLTDNPINHNVINNTEDALLRGIIHLPYEVEVYHKNGSMVMLEVSETPIVEFNKVVGVIGVGRDITKRRKDETLKKALYTISEEASKSETIEGFYKSLHEIIETLMPAKNFYIAIHNSETNLISFPYFADEYDAPPKEHLLRKGLSGYILRTKKSQIITEEIDKELQKDGIVEESGEYAKVWVGIYLEFEGKYKGVLVVQDYENENAYSSEDLKVLQFVSEQIVKTLDKEYAKIKLKNSVTELLKTQKELEIINSNKDKFFSIIAHDLRSPFMALMGISQMISEDMDSMSVGDVKEMTSNIHSSTKNLYKLLENLLSWSRLQMGAYQIVPKIINLKEVTVSVKISLQLSTDEKNITIMDNVEEIYAYADDDCVKTILRNLINNAIKFTNRGGKIILLAKSIDNFVEFSVEDNGVGMREKTLNNLFFITEKNSLAGTEEETGTGLGLILCKELVEKNDGKLKVESEFGKGSKFTFTLPSKNVIK